MQAAAAGVDQGKEHPRAQSLLSALGAIALGAVLLFAFITLSSKSNAAILPQLLVNAVISGSIYALASAGLALTFGILRILNFAHGHLMMGGAYCFYFLTVDRGLSVPAAIPFTVVFAVLLGWLSLRVFITPFLHLNVLLTLVTTLTLANILEAGVSMLFGVNVKSLSPGSAAQSIEFGGMYITPIQIAIVVSALVILSALAYVIHETSFGRKVRAISENSYAGESLGMSVSSLSLIIMTLSTLLAVYAGILVGYETNLQPTMGNSYTIKAFAALILGGLGNLWGTIAGAYLLGLVENLAIGLEFGSYTIAGVTYGPYSIPAGYKDAFAFMIILLVLLFKPQGLFNRKRRVG